MDTRDSMAREQDPLERAERACNAAERLDPRDPSAGVMWLRALTYAMLAQARRQPIA